MCSYPRIVAPLPGRDQAENDADQHDGGAGQHPRPAGPAYAAASEPRDRQGGDRDRRVEQVEGIAGAVTGGEQDGARRAAASATTSTTRIRRSMALRCASPPRAAITATTPSTIARTATTGAAAACTALSTGRLPSIARRRSYVGERLRAPEQQAA